MLEIEGASVVDGEVVSGNLILTKHDGTTIDAGPVLGPQGPQGPVGPASISAIPGEIKLWPGGVLPESSYGHWVWADGAVYVVATYPIAAGHIASQWRTFGGASDPGASNFRVPDLRGVTPVGMDAMPGGARANRMTRAVAITIAGRTGEETHIVAVSEMPAHGHVVNAHNHGGGDHRHNVRYSRGSGPYGAVQADVNYNFGDYLTDAFQNSGVILTSEAPGTNNIGGGGAHENVQPTVFVPYIVKLDD
jgi:microcystin-dependent protein